MFSLLHVRLLRALIKINQSINVVRFHETAGRGNHVGKYYEGGRSAITKSVKL